MESDLALSTHSHPSDFSNVGQWHCGQSHVASAKIYNTCPTHPHLIWREVYHRWLLFCITNTQTARKIHVAKFRAARVHLLITTDVAARGIDIPLIHNVINLDFPPKPELFVHRVGRAARMGRSGTAYSILTREELPYLMDLNLYLGRSVVPAPLIPDAEAVRQHQAAGSAVAPSATSSESVYGSYPATLLGPCIEHLREVEAAATELNSVARTLSNAYKLYLRTRPAPSPESSKRAKELPLEGPHPLLLSIVPQSRYADIENEAALAQFTSALRNFRPVATVLEAEIAAVKSPHTMGATLLDVSVNKSSSNDVMQRKRAEHAVIIERERKKRAEAEEAKAAGKDAGATGQKRKQKQDGAQGFPVASLGSEDTDDFEAGEDEDGGMAPGSGSSAAREAAALAMAIGDGVLNEGRYR